MPQPSTPAKPIPPAILTQLKMDLPLLVRLMLRVHDAQASADANRRAIQSAPAHK